ncbi:unnamed protein product [Eruca vesicaria subsp. sativa]|uniref:F-box domain-containing protein n=1 Tax=Eruca vesicaria subsp. sativa TaxID=29727 RepID=A0ABC8LKA1_ERUVS|nr:unnamed protein product [Eruca vesicaria subsp. sativa]
MQKVNLNLNMETPNWSELCTDILRVLLERLSFVDFHRAKTVCRNWYMCSKQTLRPRSGSPLLMILSPEDDYVLFNPDEDKVYKTNRDFSGTRFLANSGNCFLALDSESNLHIEHVFNEKKRIKLPPIESMKSDLCSLKRVGDKVFNENGFACFPEKGFSKSVEDLRGVLWVEEDVEGKEQEYTVAWFFDKGAEYIAFCKNGDDYYRTVSTRLGVHYTSQGISDMILQGDILYVYTTRKYVRLLDLSGQEGFKEVHRRCFILRFLPADPQSGEERLKVSYNIAVTRSGEVLLVESIVLKATSSEIMPMRMFHVYKTNPNPDSEDILHSENLSFEVDSLGDEEALLLDSGITVPAALGIQPNSIYFTRHDHVRNFAQVPSSPDICVFNLSTKKLTRFPILSSKDALWFLPS